LKQPTIIKNIKGKAVANTLFKNFSVNEILMEYDFPLLISAKSPKDENWLFKWCDSVENSSQDIWIAFKISDKRLNSLISNTISLREVVTLPEFKLYLFEGDQIFSPTNIKEVLPENLSPLYIPLEDITLQGDLINQKGDVIEGLNIKLHIFLRDLGKNKMPFSLLGKLQLSLQKYITDTVYNIQKSTKIPSFINDWSILNLSSFSSGSIKIEGETISNNEQSAKLAKSLEILTELSKKNPAKVNSLKHEIGDDAFYSAYNLLLIISTYKLSVSMNWVTDTSKGYLAIDKRRADNFIRLFHSHYQNQNSVIIQLNQEEADPLRKPIIGKGGLQSLLKNLKSKLSNDNTIQLTPIEIEKILRYGFKYGQGGFQGRLTGLAKALKRFGVSFQAI
jgi:hypothetical protein